MTGLLFSLMACVRTQPPRDGSEIELACRLKTLLSSSCSATLACAVIALPVLSRHVRATA